MSEKKILLIIDLLGSGGAQRQFVGLAKLLQEKGYDINVIYYFPYHFYKQFLDDNGIQNKMLDFRGGILGRIYKTAAYIKTFKPDVVISYLNAPNIISCLLKLLGLKYKLIVSERNTTQSFTMTERIKFCLMKYADYIVPNSYSQEKFIQSHYQCLSSKIKTITNFVDTNVFIPDYAKVRNRVIIVARVSPQKNVLKFLEAIKLLKEKGLKFKIDWYGSHSIAQNEYFSECMTKRDDYEISSYIDFHDAKLNIIEEYQSSDVFCLPSTYEGFPNVICEAMSCGLPILCSDVCDNPLIVEDGINGFLFNPYSPTDIAEKFEHYLSLNSDTKQLMKERSREMAIKKFSATSFINKYLSLIN